ncbi:MAG: hypothetical protein H6Q54_2036, partial [Deltaproteobacteria bacterium]|nr:hypothetical protein [Deltaproteobacteria bacterium]
MLTRFSLAVRHESKRRFLKASSETFFPQLRSAEARPCLLNQFRLNLSFAIYHLLAKKVWQRQDRKGKSDTSQSRELFLERQLENVRHPVDEVERDLLLDFLGDVLQVFL